MASTADIVQLKIERAEKHIDETDSYLSLAHHDVKPYQLAFKNDPHKRESILYVKKEAEGLTPMLPLIIGDAISNLHSALDYLACELVTAKELISTGTAFPITEYVPATTDQKARYERQVCGMREDAKDIIKKLEPYRGRDNNFWTLHKLNNINKHRALITVAYGALLISPTGQWHPHVSLEEGAELLRVPLDLPDKDKIRIFPTIAFNEPEADVVHHAVLNVLRGCLRDVQRAASALRPYRRTHIHLSGGNVLHSA